MADLPPDVMADAIKALKAASDPSYLAGLRRQEGERREREARERAEQARRTQLKAFKMVSPRTRHWECPGCGALVVDREHHLDWHIALAATAAEAREATWRVRPLGTSVDRPRRYINTDVRPLG